MKKENHFDGQARIPHREVNAGATYEVYMNSDQNNELYRSLTALKLEHRRLDEEIRQIMESVEADQLKVSRMKKQKLTIKDEIRQLEDRLMPDIIA